MSSKPAIHALVAALVLTSATEAAANDGIVGGIIGGVIGGVIANEANRNRQQQQRVTTTQRAPQASSVSSATRAANRETQTALNYFGFDAGTVDGVVGRGTRAAMASYQSHMGYPATGTLSQFERDFLLTSYQRAIAGGGTTAQLIATNPMGAKGLLTMFRDQSLGLPPTAPGTLTAAPTQPGVLALAPAGPVPAPAFPTLGAPAAPAPAFPSVAAAAPRAAPPPTPQGLGAAAPALPNFAAAAPAPALPNFGASQSADASLSSHCNRVNLEATTNGGFVTVASMTNPKQALEEQFCLARTYVQRTGEELAAQVPGTTPEQIAVQCEAFAPALSTQIAALSAQPLAAVVQSVEAFVPQTGMTPAQLTGTARICLSSGYRTDNMDVAVGSALILVALGERGYAELLGHHLSQGFGAAARPDLALDWYDAGLAAGVAPVIAPGQPERSELVRRAAYAFGGREAPAEVPVPAAAPAPAALPSFTVNTSP